MGASQYLPARVRTPVWKLLQVLVGTDRWFDEDTRVTIALEGLNEKVDYTL